MFDSQEFDCIGSIDPRLLAEQEERLRTFFRYKAAMRLKTEEIKRVATKQYGSQDETPRQMA